MNPIAELAALLMAHGLPSDVVRSAIDLAEQHASNRRMSADVGGLSAYERRKEYDRNRQAEKRRQEKAAKEAAQSERPPKKARMKSLPSDWRVPTNAFDIAAELGLAIDPIEDRFRDYLKSTGKMYLDYDAAFCNFIRNTPKFNGGQTNGQRAPNHRTTGHDAILAAASKEARKIVGNGELAGTTDEAEFSFGDGTEPNGSAMDQGSAQSFGASHCGPAGIEGEIIPPNKTAFGLSGGRRR